MGETCLGQLVRSTILIIMIGIVCLLLGMVGMRADNLNTTQSSPSLPAERGVGGEAEQALETPQGPPRPADAQAFIDLLRADGIPASSARLADGALIITLDQSTATSEGWLQDQLTAIADSLGNAYQNDTLPTEPDPIQVQLDLNDGSDALVSFTLHSALNYSRRNITSAVFLSLADTETFEPARPTQHQPPPR